MLTMCGEDLVEKAMEAGASGYLQKDSAPKEIANAVHQVYQGLCPISASLTRGLVSETCRTKKKGTGFIAHRAGK